MFKAPSNEYTLYLIDELATGKKTVIKSFYTLATGPSNYPWMIFLFEIA